jgi:hypothetical protein
MGLTTDTCDVCWANMSRSLAQNNITSFDAVFPSLEML